MPRDVSELILQFDGGARGNPGPAGIGLTLRAPDGRMIYELGDFIGQRTNNEAEYTALLRGLEIACKMGVQRLLIRADSELVVRQLQGRYRVKSPALRPLFERVSDLLRRIPKWSIEHIYRDDNQRPDELANLAMDRRGKVEPEGNKSEPTML